MDASPTKIPVAGWYEDPRDATLIRFWNGSGWTDATQPKPSAAVPTPPVAASTPPNVVRPPPVPLPRPSDVGPIAADSDRAKIRNAVIVASLVLIVAIGGAFLLLGSRDNPSSAQEQSSEQANTADAQAAQEARTAQSAIEAYSTNNNGSYAGATVMDLRDIEATLPDSGSLQVAAGKATYSLSVSSNSGDSLTIQRLENGSLSYNCSTPGTGICSTSGSWG